MAVKQSKLNTFRVRTISKGWRNTIKSVVKNPSPVAQICSILFYSILFYSILFYSILFYSILFYSILFYSNLYFKSQCHLSRTFHQRKVERKVLWKGKVSLEKEFHREYSAIVNRT